jgi:ABC-2 type transport system ATP-binding protein
MNVITVENVSKAFRRRGGQKLFRDYIKEQFNPKPDEPFYALKHVSFQVAAQESVAIIGANGAGKSTLLGLIVGLSKPDEGRIEVNGRIAALLELGSGFHPDLTGVENVFLNAALLGFNEKQTRELLGAIVEFAELKDSINQTLRTYSSGMVVRLAFAIAVHADPAILIVDEVLAVGDVAFQEKCNQKVQALRKEGRTMVCVSHAPAVMQLCDRAIWLDRGEMIMDGPSSEVVAAYVNYMAAPHAGLPDRKITPAPKVRVMRAGAKSKAR